MVGGGSVSDQVEVAMEDLEVQPKKKLLPTTDAKPGSE